MSFSDTAHRHLYRRKVACKLYHDHMSVFVHIYIFFQHAANVMKQFRNFDDNGDVRGIGKLMRDRSVRSKGNVKITIDPSQCLSDVSTYVHCCKVDEPSQ